MSKVIMIILFICYISKWCVDWTINDFLNWTETSLHYSELYFFSKTFMDIILEPFKDEKIVAEQKKTALQLETLRNQMVGLFFTV